MTVLRVKMLTTSYSHLSFQWRRYIFTFAANLLNTATVCNSVGLRTLQLAQAPMRQQCRLNAFIR
jgi:hypothetical protein